MRDMLVASLVGLVVAGSTGCHGGASPPQKPGEAASTQIPNQELAAFLKKAYDRELDHSPLHKTYLGIIDDSYDELDDVSDEHRLAVIEEAKEDLAYLREHFDPSTLNAEDRLTYQLFEFRSQQRIARERWYQHDYPVHQMRGPHSSLPAMLINQHRVDTVEHARAYIARLRAFPRFFEQVETKLRARQERGILPPAFVFPKVIEASRNVISGAPFDDGEDSDLLADFEKKVSGLDGVSDDEKQALISDAKRALVDSVAPAYRSLIKLLEKQAEVATTDDGVWKLPDGDEYYRYRLQQSTTRRDVTAQEVHETGLAEVARIHDEMRAIMAEVKFEGTLQEFFEHTRTHDRFFESNDDAGRQAYLDKARAYVDDMRSRLPEIFVTLPEDELVVKRVEPYREGAAGKAFYWGPAPDGSRPGIFYANLRDMRSMPTYQLEALVYHEGIPGHHLQNAVAQGLDHLPRFRRFGGYTAYGEGWGLYAEYLPKELGFYDDPYSDFGRLAMELWRAARLVVDTGIHVKKWTRREAIDYLLENTPNPEGDCVHAIERYIVMPGQATAYKIGMLELLRLRELASEALGDDFDLPEFHEVVLASGPMPLEILADEVERWIASKGGLLP